MQPPSPTARRHTSRRRLLACFAAVSGVTAATLTGCHPLFGQRAKPARPDPDVTAATHALDQEGTVLTAYADAVRRHPGLEHELRAFSKRHEAHLAALRARLPAGHPARRTATPTASPTASPAESPTASTTAKKRSIADDLDALADAERKAASALASDALDAGASLAQVLASMSVCATAHVELLGRVKR